MKKCALVVCALVGVAGGVGVARANNVEFRVVELSGQTEVTFQDFTLNYAVQAKVTGAGLALWGFNSIRLNGEAESSSVLGRLMTSNVDGTYYAGSPTPNSLVGTGGLARSYAYLAGIDSSFNGLINVSAGTFVNTADNEMGLVSGSAGGQYLVGTPGVDGNSDNTPDSVPLPTSIMQNYFAQDTWIDIYRFRVVVTNFSERTIPITLEGADARVFDTVYQNGTAWGPVAHAGPESISLSGASFHVPAPSSAALLGLGGLIAARRRRG